MSNHGHYGNNPGYHNSGMSPTMNSEPLPMGWEMRWDQATGWPFFIDHNTQRTSWQDPRNSRMGTTSPHHHSKVREIPVQHEGHSFHNRQQHPTSPQHYNQPDLSVGGRQIPIQRVRSDSPQMSPKINQPEPMARSNTSSPSVKDIPIMRESAPNRGSPQYVGRASGHHNASQAPDSYEAAPTYSSTERKTPVSPAQSPPPTQPNTLDVNNDPARNRSPSPQNLTQLERVELILAESEELQRKVNAYSGSKKDKEYKYLEEMLTRLLLKLDSIDSEGKEEIRNVRRQAVKLVSGSLDMLELKACANDVPAEKMQTDNTNDSTNASHVKEMRLGSEVGC